jgi:hypothetical protein
MSPILASSIACLSAMHPRALPVAVLAAALTGCATTRIESEWRDPAAAQTSLLGQRVLVVCRAPDDTTRRVCEDEWARQAEGFGVAAVRSYTLPGFAPKSGDLSDEVRGAAREARATAIVASTVQTNGGTTWSRGGPTVGVGVGGVGGSGGGNVGFGGVSIGFPVGGSAQRSVGLGASTSVVDVASGKLLWSANASAPTAGEQRAQLGDLARVTLEAMRKAGLL